MVSTISVLDVCPLVRAPLLWHVDQLAERDPLRGDRGSRCYELLLGSHWGSRENPQASIEVLERRRRGCAQPIRGRHRRLASTHHSPLILAGIVLPDGDHPVVAG